MPSFSRQQLRALAIDAAGFVHSSERTALPSPWTPRSKAPELEPFATTMWALTMESVEQLRCLDLPGERELVEALLEAHVDLLQAIVESEA